MPELPVSAFRAPRQAFTWARAHIPPPRSISLMGKFLAYAPAFFSHIYAGALATTVQLHLASAAGSLSLILSSAQLRCFLAGLRRQGHASLDGRR